MLSGAILSVLGGYYANKLYWQKKDKNNYLALIQSVIDELESNKNNLTAKRLAFSVSVENFKNLEKDPSYIRYCPPKTRERIKNVYSDLRVIIGQARKYPKATVEQLLASFKTANIEELIDDLSNLLKKGNRNVQNKN